MGAVTYSILTRFPLMAAILAAVLLSLAVMVDVPARELAAVNQPFLVAVSALNEAVALPSRRMSECREGTVYVGWSTGVTAGAVAVETAVDETYTGTWHALSTVTYTSGAPKQEAVQITGTYWAFRHRISTAVVGGTVSTWFVCN